MAIELSHYNWMLSFSEEALTIVVFPLCLKALALMILPVCAFVTQAPQFSTKKWLEHH